MHDRHGSRFFSRLVLGLSVALVGALLLLDQMRLLDAASILYYWPVLIVVVGLVKALQPSPGHSRFFGVLLVVFGGWLLLDRMGYVFFEWHYIWPALLVLVGLRIAFGGIAVRRWLVYRPRQAGDAAGSGDSAGSESSDAEIDALAVLGSVARTSTAQGFRGGSATAILGSCRIDLRRATLDGEAVIETIAIWGGITILVPQGWGVVVKGVPILGGFEDKTKPPIGEPTQRLVIRGIAIMGGVEVKNKRELE